QLAYLAFSRIPAPRQRLVADSGRVSISSTRSPIPQAFAPSCALYFLVRRMTLPYLGCLTRSSTSTTTVLSILSLTTRPSRTLRYPREACSAVSFTTGSVTATDSLIGVRLLLFHDDDAELAFALHGVDARDLLAHGAQPPVALQLPGGRLETEVEQLDLGLGQLELQLILGGGSQVSGNQSLGHHASPTSRFTNLHFIGSLCMARRRASRAT